MPRSQLLKDLVNGKESLENILMRLKVILTDLKNETMISWVNGELSGYQNGDVLPEYRLKKGNIIGTFMTNGQFLNKNAPVPLKALLDDETIDRLESIPLRDSIGALEETVSNLNKGKATYGKPIPASYCHSISTYSLQIQSMYAQLSPNLLIGVISNIKQKLIDVIMELESQFDNLDDLDIRSQIVEHEPDIEKINYNIEQIIFDDNSIKLGDKNNISKTRIGNFFGGKR